MKTRMASVEDSQNAYDFYGKISKKHGYIPSITGSTIFGTGEDIDLILTASVDADCSAAKVAQELLLKSVYILFYEQEEDGSAAAAVFIDPSGVIIDCYVRGLPDV